MAQFEGAIKEFIKYIGAYARIKVMHIAAQHKNKVGRCEECGISKSLHAAHLKGMERPLIISNILREFTEDNIIRIDLDEFEERFIAAHLPIDSTIRILCKDCHRKYDKLVDEKQSSEEIYIDEGAVIEKLINVQMNKSKAIKIAADRDLIPLTNSNTLFSNINSAQDVWWLEPPNEKFKNNLYIFLNDDKTKNLHIFKLRVDTISNPANHFIQRNDNRKTNCSDIYIPVSQIKFTDKKGFDFTRYLVETIEY